MGLPHQTGLRSTGPALSGTLSSYHPPDEEEDRDESLVGDAESTPMMDPITIMTSGQISGVIPSIIEDTPEEVASIIAQAGESRPPVNESMVAEQENIRKDQSPNASAFMPSIRDTRPSLTVGIMSKPTAIVSSPEPSAAGEEEDIDYETTLEDHVGDDGDGDDSFDDVTNFDDMIGPPSDKASAYTHISSTYIVIVTPPPEQQTTTSFIPQQLPLVTITSSIEKPPQMKITLTSMKPVDVSDLAQAGALMALPSSPFHLEISVASSASTPKLRTYFLLSGATSGALMSSPVTSLSPVVVPNVLKVLMGQLESTMEMTIKVVSAGQATFEAFRPILMNSLNNIKCVDNAQWFHHCTKKVSSLEEDLKALEDLGCDDIEANIASTFVNIQAEEGSRHEAVERGLTEKELQVIHLQEQYTQCQDELTASSTALADVRKAIIQAKETHVRLQAEVARVQVEVTRQRAQFARDESIVTKLALKNAEVLVNYTKEAQALENAKKEAAAKVLNEDELRKRAEIAVRTAHEGKLSVIKSQLTSYKLMDSST